MSEKKLVNQERPRGRGELFRDGVQIATVTYRLSVDQVFHVTRGDLAPGIKQTTGSISVIDGETDLVDGSILELHLDDGRIMRFFAKSGSPIDPTYQIANAHEKGIASPEEFSH